MDAVDEQAFKDLCGATFGEHEGLLLRVGAWTPNTLAEWRRQLGSDLSGIESVINHAHVGTLFWQPSKPKVSDIAAIGRQVQAAWTQTLEEAFPGTKCQVRFVEPSDADPDLMDFQITAFKVRDA